MLDQYCLSMISLGWDLKGFYGYGMCVLFTGIYIIDAFMPW